MTVPNKKLDSSLANFTVLFDDVVISAIYAKEAGLVAEPKSPFNNLPNIKRGNKKITSIYFFQQEKEE